MGKYYYQKTSHSVELTCHTCGVKFWRGKAWLKNSKNGLFFCDQKCMGKHFSVLHEVPDDEVYKIDKKTGCWNCVYAVGGSGYCSKKGRKAHRYYYEKWVGPIPEGLVLDHLCRNRRCINPKHLEPVTQNINTQRGLLPVMDIEGVRLLREMFSTGNFSKMDLSRMFDISHGTVRQIVGFKTWVNA